MRGELAAMIDKGMKHDEIIQAFVAKYGSQEMLGAPIDEGFNRLAWLVPYLVGGTGIVLVGLAASRWSRRSDSPDASASPGDPDMEQRLDDELRDLD
jgi:cytochrome c-type biogenesis protein CcmH/NrfF